MELGTPKLPQNLQGNDQTRVGNIIPTPQTAQTQCPWPHLHRGLHPPRIQTIFHLLTQIRPTPATLLAVTMLTLGRLPHQG